jgi:GT2 family glycosyltransferase
VTELPSPALHAVVVAYGPPHLLETCLTSLGGVVPVIVVDNGSSLSTRAVAERHGARYVDPGQNLGFAAGVNRAVAELATLAIEHGGLPDVLLVNPDATVTPVVVDHLHRVLASDPDLAAVAPAQRRPDGVEADRVCWPFPSPSGMWLQATGLGRLRRQHCQFLIGAVLLIRGVALFEIGGFDERFFLYAEETDWQRRATLAGWRVRYCPEVAAVHLGAGTDSDPRRREIRFHAANERYIRKWFGWTGWYSFRLAHIFGALVRVLLCSGEHRKSASTRLRLYALGPDRVARRYMVIPNDRDANITTSLDKSQAGLSDACSPLDDDRTIDRN